MIGTIDIKVNAAKPNFPLSPFYSFINSPSQVRIINVPKAIGKWAVTSVQITANYPDNTSRSVSCTLVGGCWSATLPASTAVGQSLMGFKVTASGTDESGAAVTGYVLGKGDVFILNDDSTITIGSTTYYIHLHDTVPQTPQKADLCLINGAWKIYNGTAWIGFGGGTGDISHSEFADMTADLDADESSLGDVMTKVNTLITKLKGTTAAIVALLALGSFAAVDVQTAKLSTLPGKTMVVTNVTYTSDLPSDYTTTNAVKSLVSSPDLVNTGAVVVAEAYADAGLASKIGTNDFTTATNVLATAITNKADKSELAGKQDKLPYLTNAIPAGVISCAPWATNGSISNDFPIVTNAYTKSEADGRYLKLSGGEVEGEVEFDDNIYVSGDDSSFYQLLTISGVSGSGLCVNDGSGKDFNYRCGYVSNSEESYYIEFPIWLSGDHVLAVTDDIPTDIVRQSTIDGVTYTNASQILSSAENTAGTKIARGYTPTNAVVALSRSVQYVADPAGVTIQVPTVIPQGIRDWVVYVQNTGAATIPLTLDSSVSWYGADTAYTNALKNGKMTALYFTEITTNKFAIGRAELDAIQAAH